MTDDIVDPDDFCRSCGGKGGFRDWDSQRKVYVREPCYQCRGTGRRRKVYVREPCYQCRGTGRRTVRVDDP